MHFGDSQVNNMIKSIDFKIFLGLRRQMTDKPKPFIAGEDINFRAEQTVRSSFVAQSTIKVLK